MEKGYKPEQLANIVKGKLIQRFSSAIIEHIVLDSRKLIYPAQSVFFALKGARRDGHQFITDLYDRGVKTFIVNDIPENDLSEANFIKVKDTVQALQLLVAFHRKSFNIPVIGITGSNGKTIVKEWLYQLLQPDFSICRSPRSYNSQTGVPLSVWQLSDFHDLAIFEAGISQPDEMGNLQKIIAPTIGIFTNIGKAHSEGFLNIRHKINEKLKLFAHTEVIIFRRDYLDINECILTVKAQMKRADPDFEGFHTFCWSMENPEADVCIKSIEKKPSHTYIQLEHNGAHFIFSIPFIDDASIENAIHCWLVLRFMKIDPEIIAQRMPGLNRVAMRLEMNDAINNCSLINDSYNSDINSLTIALDFLSQQKQHPHKTLILSDILQSGLSDEKLYRDVANLMSSKGVTRFIGIGPAISRQHQLFVINDNISASFFLSTEEFLKSFSGDQYHDETILLKGARKFEFEQISKYLIQKAHETILEVDLNALLHNLTVFQSQLGSQTKIMVMVKAFSYGSGSFEIANALQFHKIDYLAVAYSDEGIELRKAGINLPIMIMNPEQQSFEGIIQYHLEPELYSLRLLKQFQQTIAFSSKPFPEGYPVHLELETGMNRLGIGAENVEELLQLLTANKSLRVKSVFTHLAGSEDPLLDEFSRIQINRFQKLSEKIVRQLPYPVLRHVLNSAGIIRFPEAHFDMVRLGIGLYGIDSTNKIQHQLRNVSTLKTTISQIKKIRAEETVGYGRKGMALTDLMVATVGIGYADGLSRNLSIGKGKMMVRGVLTPIIGNINMDMAMIDITAVPEAEEGDEVIVFGDMLPVQKLAEWAGTIPYEVLSTISRRVKRVYFQE
ncbi:MAG: bifunctional UDP-N-acetylmuramoyl-tripeptide:D-alanyl-D-alanine ligase/alanine racemase [Chitinophagales bacterium]|nr:bifunctional UDP-N-acetylmuramoyl-tripeptide:D-alanyl-D-alanine ligase/alanine racemase [Chitinophagales bacterium]